MIWDSLLVRANSAWRDKVRWAGLLHLVFYLGYPLLQRYPLRPAQEVPWLPWDAIFPFVPGAVWGYQGLFLLMPLTLLALPDAPAVRRHGWELLLIMASAFLVFLLWPTFVPRPAGAPEGFYGLMMLLDRPTNALPSLHAAFVMHTSVALWRLCPAWRWRVVAGIVGCGIVWCAGATHQHRAMDLLAGLALGLAVPVIRELVRGSPHA
jgi:hypothetical protein